MNIFNQNYHIQIHTQVEKKKKKKNFGCMKNSMERPLVNIL